MAFRYSDKYKKYSLDMHVNVTRDEFLKQFDPEALAKDIISTGAFFRSYFYVSVPDKQVQTLYHHKKGWRRK